jgi:hypothetical protein
MSTPKQPVINPILFTYIDYSIGENNIGKMASFLPYTHSVSHLLTFLVAQLQFLLEWKLSDRRMYCIWNVRSLYRAGSLTAAARELARHCTRFSNVDF